MQDRAGARLLRASSISSCRGVPHPDAEVRDFASAEAQLVERAQIQLNPTGWAGAWGFAGTRWRGNPHTDPPLPEHHPAQTPVWVGASGDSAGTSV